MAPPTAPDFIRALPPTVRAAVRKACDGDWSRVTPDLVVHNNPVRSVKPPARKAPEKPPVPVSAPVAPIPAPRVRSVRKKPAERRTAPKISNKELRRLARAERLLQEQDAPVYERPLRDEDFREGFVEELPPLEHVVPAAYELNGFTEDSADGGVAYKVWHKYRNGYFGKFIYHEHVLGWGGADLDGFKAVLRRPDMVVIAPETKGKKYPVLRFRRGSMMAVMGFRSQDCPAVIAAYYNTPVRNGEQFSKEPSGSGGGARKQGGPPKSPNHVMSRLADLGATVKYDELRDPNTSEVWYEGENLGKISTKKGTPRATCESDWNRMQRKIQAIKNRKGS